MLTKGQITVLFVSFFLAVLAWVLWALFGLSLIEKLSGYKNIDQAGQWGDTFGALNAIIGAAGTCLVLATLMAQRQSLKEQQLDLHKQRFESTFFMLLNLMRELKDQPSVPGSEKTAIRVASNRMTGFEFSDSASKDSIRSTIVTAYTLRVYDPFERQISPYFRIVYTILTRISDDGVLSKSDKISYGNLLRSQLTSDEVALAGYNGLTSVSKDFSKLLTEFRILKYLPPGDHRSILENFYPKQAFEARD